MKRRIATFGSLLLLVAAMLGTTPATAKTLYVGTAEQWAGKAAELVVPTIDSAIKVAAADSVDIWVIGSATDTILCKPFSGLGGKKFSLYGGFAGTESSIGERAKVPGGAAWEFTHPTVLKDTAPANTFLNFTAIGASISIDGFTVLGKDADLNKSAIYCNAATGIGSGDPDAAAKKWFIRNCRFWGFGKSGNTDGGAINIRGNSIGAIVEHCLIENCHGKNGAAIYAENLTVRHCVIRNNRAKTTNTTTPQGGTGNCGGAVCIGANARVYDCVVENNVASFGGGLFISNAGGQLVYNNLVVGNTANDGSGIAFDSRGNVNPTGIYNNTIVNNTALLEVGGGIYISSATHQKLTNSILYGNKDSKGDIVNVHAVAKPEVFKNNIVDRDYSIEGAAACRIVSDSAAIFGAGWTLGVNSRAVNAGDSTGLKFDGDVDLAGSARVQQTLIDMGCYESDQTPPAVYAPTGLQLTAFATTINAEWDATITEGIDGYNVYANDVKNNAEVITGTTYTLTGLSLGTAYKVEVEAVKGTDASAKLSGSATTLTSDDNTPPTWPANTTLTLHGFTQTTANISFPMASDNIKVQGYHIYVNGEKKLTTTELDNMVTGLTPGTPTRIEVKPYDLSDNEGDAIFAEFTTIAANVPVVYYVFPPEDTVWRTKDKFFVFDDVNEALTAAGSTGDESQVWVARGEYTSVSLTMADKVSLYGGFAGTENSVSERIKVAGGQPWQFVNVTKLKGSGQTSIDYNKMTSNAIIKSNITTTKPITVDGFTLSDAVHGVYVESGAGLTVSSCIITNTGKLTDAAKDAHDAGGVYIMGGSATVEYSLIENNKARNGGGALLTPSGAVLRFCTIRNNTALSSGGTYSNTTSPTIQAWGGGVFVEKGTVESCIIEGNKAIIGGGIFIRGNDAKVYNCIIRANQAQLGGGLSYDPRANASTSKNVYNCMFAYNAAADMKSVWGGELPTAKGSAVGFMYNDQTLTNCIFIDTAAGATSVRAATLDGATGSEGKIVNSFVCYAADTIGGNALHPTSEDLYDAATLRPKDGFPGVDKGVAGNPTQRDVSGYPRVKGAGMDIGPYEHPEIPNAPTNLNMLEDKTEVTLSWTPSVDFDVARYAIYADPGTTGDATTLVTDTVSRATYTVTGLTMGTAYVFTVKGIDEVGQYTSALSGSIKTLNENTPYKPQNLDITSVGDNFVALKWDAAGEKADKYVVMVNGTQWTDTISASNAPTYTVQGLAPYTTYNFYVLAKNTTGDGFFSRPSNTVSVRTTDKVAPHTPPTNLATNADLSTVTSIALSWTAAEDNVGIRAYVIYIDDRAVDTTRTAQTSYVLGGLKNKQDTTYKVKVLALDSAYNPSAFSNEISATTGTNADLPVWYIGSWSNKPSNRVFTTVEDAQYDITLTTGDTTHSEIWIMAGEYGIKTSGTSGIVLHDRATSYYGGFTGTETSVGQRQKTPGGFGWDFVNPTVLKQVDDDRIFTLNGMLYDDIVIDGFTMEGTAQAVRAIYAGGTSAGGKAITIKNCIMRGFGITDGSSTENDGGAVAFRDYGDPAYMDSCLLEDNKGRNGGALYVADGNNATRIISNCYFLRNEASMQSTSDIESATVVPVNWGGGVFANAATIRNCYIAYNKASAGGGVVFRRPGSKIENCIIVNNESNYGGGVFFHAAVDAGLITNNVIGENKARRNGGGVYITNNNQQVMNNILWKNINTTQNVVENLGHQEQRTPKLLNNVVSSTDRVLGSEPIIVTPDKDKSYLFDNTYEGWHTKLNDTSILYDAGTLDVTGFDMPKTDFTGAARIVGGRIDIGPFEYQGDPNAPSAPTNLDTLSVGETTIELTWTAAVMNNPQSEATVVDYNVYLNKTKVNEAPITDTTYALTGLTPYTEYTIQVAAVSSTGQESPRTSERFTRMTIDRTAPTTPVGLQVVGVTSTSITIQWNASSDNVAVTGYKVYVDGAVEKQTAASVYSFKIEYLQPKTDYTIGLSAVDAADNESPLVSVAATTPETDGPNAVATGKLRVLNVYPNPVTSGQLTVSNGQLAAGSKLEVFTLTGSKVLEAVVAAGPTTVLNLRSLPAGIYVVKSGAYGAKIVISE